jgi:hypothetical protein
MSTHFRQKLAYDIELSELIQLRRGEHPIQRNQSSAERSLLYTAD